MELLLKVNVEDNQKIYKNNFIDGLRKFHDVYRKLQVEYKNATDLEKMRR